jgi:hypothetical protein
VPTFSYHNQISLKEKDCFATKGERNFSVESTNKCSQKKQLRAKKNKIRRRNSRRR